MFSNIVAALAALRELLAFIRFLVSSYQDIKKAEQTEKQKAAVDEFKKGDQIKLEEAIGNTNAGEPAVRRDDVQERPARH